MTPEAAGAILAMGYAVTKADAIRLAMKAVMCGCPAEVAYEATQKWLAANQPQVVGGAS